MEEPCPENSARVPREKFCRNLRRICYLSQRIQSTSLARRDRAPTLGGIGICPHCPVEPSAKRVTERRPPIQISSHRRRYNTTQIDTRLWPYRNPSRPWFSSAAVLRARRLFRQIGLEHGPTRASSQPLVETSRMRASRRVEPHLHDNPASQVGRLVLGLQDKGRAQDAQLLQTDVRRSMRFKARTARDQRTAARRWSRLAPAWSGTRPYAEHTNPPGIIHLDLEARRFTQLFVKCGWVYRPELIYRVCGATLGCRTRMTRPARFKARLRIRRRTPAAAAPPRGRDRSL